MLRCRMRVHFLYVMTEINIMNIFENALPNMNFN